MATTKRELRNRTLDEEFDTDVRLWMETLRHPGNDPLAERVNGILKRIFATLRYGVLIYRERSGDSHGWQYWAHNAWPIAAALSHGGRFLIQIPKGEKRFWDWLTGGSKNVQPIKRHLAGPFGHASLKRPLYGRIGTHGVEPNKKPERLLIIKANKEIAEIKVKGKKHISHLGHHYGMDLAVGGSGNNHEVSNQVITRNGQHGHMYFYYQEPKANRCGALLIGCEASAPKKIDQFGGEHDSEGTSGEFSPACGRKWRYLGTGPGCRYPDGVLYTKEQRKKEKKKGKMKDDPPPVADTLVMVLDKNWMNVINPNFYPFMVAQTSSLPAGAGIALAKSLPPVTSAPRRGIFPKKPVTAEREDAREKFFRKDSKPPPKKPKLTVKNIELYHDDFESLSADQMITDAVIAAWYKGLSEEYSNLHFVTPGIARLLKTDEAKVILPGVGQEMKKKNFCFIPVNNAVGLGEGTHWSLLLWNKKNKTAAHYDSLGGLNSKHAGQMAKNLGAKVSNEKAPRQTGINTCGVYLMRWTQMLAAAANEKKKKVQVKQLQVRQLKDPEETRADILKWMQDHKDKIT